MPRLTGDQETELEGLFATNADKPDSWFAGRFPLSVQAVNKRRRKFKLKFNQQHAASTYAAAANGLGKVEESLNQKLDNDVEELRRKSFFELNTAIQKGDREAALKWFDRAHANTRLRAEIGRALGVFIDARTQIVNGIRTCDDCLEHLGKTPDRLEQLYEMMTHHIKHAIAGKVLNETLDLLCPGCRQKVLECLAPSPGPVTGSWDVKRGQDQPQAINPGPAPAPALEGSSQT